MPWIARNAWCMDRAVCHGHCVVPCLHALGCARTLGHASLGRAPCWVMLYTGLCTGLWALHACEPPFTLQASLRTYNHNVLSLLAWIYGLDGFFLGWIKVPNPGTSILTRCSTSTWLWELTIAAPMHWSKNLIDYGWENIRVKAGHSIPSLSYAVFTLTWDVLGVASCSNRNFIMQYCMLSSRVSRLVPDSLSSETSPCTRDSTLYWTFCEEIIFSMLLLLHKDPITIDNCYDSITSSSCITIWIQYT